MKENETERDETKEILGPKRKETKRIAARRRETKGGEWNGMKREVNRKIGTRKMKLNEAREIDHR